MIPSFFRVRTLPETASTNEDSKIRAAAGEAEGLVLRAERQTAGKGRQGRVWDSPPGNLYASVLLRPHAAPQEAALYSFATALAVYDAVRAALPQADVCVKWPNDVLVSGKKISGLLLEAAPVEDGLIPWLVVGVGINVAHHPANGLYPTTSLAAEGAKARVETVLESFLAALDHWRDVMAREGFAPLRQAWLAVARKGAMKVRLPYEELNGVFADLDDKGRLILLLPDGTQRAIDAGDVFFPA